MTIRPDDSTSEIKLLQAELQRVQDALRESEARLDHAERIAHIGHWEWRPGTGEVHWSEENYRIFGLPPDMPPSMDAFFKAVHPDDRACVKSTIDESLRLMKPYDVDMRIVRGDGSQRTLNVRGQVDAGQPLRMFGTIMDVTGSRAAEAARVGTEARYRSLFESMDAAVLLMQGPVCIDCNPATLTLFGLSTRDEIVGRTPLDFALPIQPNGMTAVEMIQWNSEQTLAKGIHVFEWQARRKNGEQFTMEVRLLPYSINGENFFQCIALDITERKRSEEALRASEQIIRTMLDAVDEAFIVVDPEYRIVTANRGYSRMFSDDGSAVGRHCYEVAHKTDRPCFQQGLECSARKVFETGEPHSMVNKHLDADGRMSYFETRAFPLRDSAGAVTSVIETINNVTEKRLLEEERLKTQKLEAIGMLAGGIAHDFNNMLQGVFGYIALARSGYDKKERCLEMLGQAEQTLQLSVNLTKQLLTFSKGGKPVKSLLSLPSVIENSVKFALSGSKINYRIDCTEDLWMVEADEGQIAQVIQNIVLNADQAMPAGGTAVISARNRVLPDPVHDHPLPPGTYVEIAIEDNGAGIPARYLDRIFDPYFTTREKGSGLGLATSDSIIRNHGGLIHVASQPGTGSIFSLFLPAITDAGTPRLQHRAPAASRKGRILFMDDDALIRTIAREMILELGHTVDFAEDGGEAIKLFQAALGSGSFYDVAILDLMIRGGGMGGTETIKQIRTFAPGVKAIVSSGYAADTIVADYRMYGFDACLVKPYDFQKLRDTLNELLA